MTKILIYSQEDLDLLLELTKTENEELQQENKILKENAENNDKVVDKVNWENQLLKKENKQLKLINKEYERLNKENDRGFKITNVKEYDIDELLSYKKYKDNWNKLKEYVNKMHEYFLYTDVNEIYKQNMKEDNPFPNLFNLSELNASDKILSSICKKMQEIERSDSNDSN